MKPHHLSPADQAAGLEQWGRAGSFRCAACDTDCTDAAPAGGIPTAFPGLVLAVCGPCARHLAQSAGFRRDTLARVRGRSMNSILTRTADLVGVTGPALRLALQDVSRTHPAGPKAFHLVDAALQVPAGSVEGALRQVFQVGATQ